MNDFATEVGPGVSPAGDFGGFAEARAMFDRTSPLVAEDQCSAPLNAKAVNATEGRLALTIFQLGKALAHAADRLVPESGVDANSYWIMSALQATAVSSQQELAEICGIGVGTMVGELDRLERAGFAERHRDPSDRRRSVVELTDAGRAALDRADQFADTIMEQLLPGLDAAARRQLLALLRKGMTESIARTPAG